MSNQYTDIYQLVSLIPAGHVATYGQIARMLNRPHSARLVGYALAALSDDQDIPWHRVVNARGEISLRAHAGYEDLQRSLLEDEGILFNQDGSIDLALYLWE